MSPKYLLQIHFDPLTKRTCPQSRKLVLGDRNSVTESAL